MLSMDSLIAAINYSDVSYLDTGDVMYEPRISHPPEYAGSVPDLKKIFVTDYLWGMTEQDSLMIKLVLEPLREQI